VEDIHKHCCSTTCVPAQAHTNERHISLYVCLLLSILAEVCRHQKKKQIPPCKNRNSSCNCGNCGASSDPPSSCHKGNARSQNGPGLTPDRLTIWRGMVVLGIFRIIWFSAGMTARTMWMGLLIITCAVMAAEWELWLLEPWSWVQWLLDPELWLLEPWSEAWLSCPES